MNDQPLSSQEFPPTEGEPAMPAAPAVPGPQQPIPEYPPYPRPNTPAAAPSYAPPPAPAAARRARRPGGCALLAGGCLFALGALLLLAAVFGGAALALQLGAESVTGSQTHTFAVAGAPHVVIRSDFGDVRVEQGAAGQVTVAWTAEVRSISHSAAQRELDRLAVSATQDGDTITLDTTVPRSSWFSGFLDRSLSITVTAPARAALDLTSSAGDISVRGVSGVASIQTNAGNVTLEAVALGGGSAIRTSAGDIRLSGVAVAGTTGIHTNAGDVTGDLALASGTALDIGTNAGAVRLSLPRATDAHLSASTDIGHITISGWNVPASQNGVGAGVTGDLNPNPTSTLTVTTNAGSIQLTAR